MRKHFVYAGAQMKNESTEVAQNSSRQSRKSSERRNVTFELPKAEYVALQDDAATRGLDSIHQRAREIVIDYLSDRSQEEQMERISALEQELAHVGELIRRLTYCVITHAAGKDSAEANAWIRKHMGKQ